MDLCRDTALSAADIIRLLKLTPHPEGGHFRETFRDAAGDDGRPHSTAIYFLLARGERSHWHRIDAAEVWHWYAGAPLELAIGGINRRVARLRLGPDLAAGERPQAVVPPQAWQAADSGLCFRPVRTRAAGLGPSDGARRRPAPLKAFHLAAISAAFENALRNK